MKSVYSYKDYRKYLNYYFSERQKRTPSFSVSGFSKKVGFASGNFLNMVLQGKRNLSWDAVIKISQALEFDFTEQQYFEAMVGFAQCEEKELQEYHSLKMKQLMPAKELIKENLGRLEGFEKWYYPLILIAMHGRHFPQGREKLKEFIDISDLELQDIVKNFVRLGALRESEKGYQLGSIHVKTVDKKASSQAYKTFAEQQFELSKVAFDKLNKNKAQFAFHSFSAGKKTFELYSKIIDDCIKQVDELSDNQPFDQMYQLNIQLFPVDKNLKG